MASAKKYACDTSVAVAALDSSHEFHAVCRKVAVANRPVLAGHAAFETYSVLSRLPGSQAVSTDVVGQLMTRAFPGRCWLTAEQHDALLRRLPSLAIIGGAVYVALVGEAARANGRLLLTRDVRARRVYEALEVAYEFVD